MAPSLSQRLRELRDATYGLHHSGPCLACAAQVKLKPLVDHLPDAVQALEWALPWLEEWPLPAYDQKLRDHYAVELERAHCVLAKIERALGEDDGR